MIHAELRRLLTRLAGLLFPRRRLRRDIEECVAALPVLRAQIREAAQHVEAAVTLVCGNFQSIADRSHGAVAKAAEMMGSGQAGGGSVEESIETSRATISLLLQRLEHAGHISSLAIARMEEIEQSVKGMESLLEEVQKISFANKIVALNAKIEAVHVGAIGAGFEVVAEEVSRQAERTGGLTEGIASRIQETRDRAHSAAGKLKEFVADDMAQTEDSRNAAHSALQVLAASHRNACESVGLMTSENTRLREEISQAIMNLQFQDRFGQRVAHVADALEKMQAMLGRQGPSFALTGGDSGNSLLEDVHSSYSMNDERMAHSRCENGTAVHPPAAGQMEVELF
jgi:methyl-accepting chemotaxis protein